MIRIEYTPEFKERYRMLPLSVHTRADKQENFFRYNPFHPSLHTEKLNPKQKGVWSFRIDKKYRIIFRFLDTGSVLFLTVGPHDWVYRMHW
ncbi:MAG: type II toxin-antitoxin system RelE/ParE family toxin [Patescibacteria group bacterium]